MATDKRTNRAWRRFVGILALIAVFTVGILLIVHGVAVSLNGVH